MPQLRADCSRCAGLCCVAPAFARSSDFALDKPAGTACPHLDATFRCGIHGSLRERGFPGCTVFDCLGAGQQVVQVTFGGRDWRAEPELARPMFAAFGVMRALHELLFLLDEAAALRPSPALDAVLSRVRDATGLDAAGLAGLDVGALHRAADVRLREVSAAVRGRRSDAEDGADPAGRPALDLARADLTGRRLRDLRGADLRGALLLGADLRGADLREADLIGADLRGTDLRWADLSTAFFVTPLQLAAARGDATTRLGPRHERPAHWPT